MNVFEFWAVPIIFLYMCWVLKHDRDAKRERDTYEVGK